MKPSRRFASFEDPPFLLKRGDIIAENEEKEFVEDPQHKDTVILTKLAGVKWIFHTSPFSLGGLCDHLTCSGSFCHGFSSISEVRRKARHIVLYKSQERTARCTRLCRPLPSLSTESQVARKLKCRAHDSFDGGNECAPSQTGFGGSQTIADGIASQDSFSHLPLSPRILHFFRAPVFSRFFRTHISSVF